MNNTVIYTRYSSVGQNEQSIEAQIRVCKEFAESKGFNVVKVYIDKARSAWKDDVRRPDFEKMIQDAESGAFQHIIVYKFDRFSRSRVDSMMYKAQLKKRHGIRVLSATEPVSDDEGGEIYEMFLEWNDEKYSQRLSKRVRDGLDTSVANGTFCGGYLIYGYKIDLEPVAGKAGRFIKRVSIDNEQAEHVRFLFQEYANGVEKKDIADALNEKGHRLKGKPFRATNFDKWINNPKYTGEFTFGGRLCTNMYPPIIDKALFQVVQERLNKNKYFAGGTATARVPYLLTGKAKCAHCDTDMVSDGGTSKAGKQHHYYACKKKKKNLCHKKREHKDVAEEYTTECVHDFLSDPANAEVAVNDTLNYRQDRTSEESLRSVEVRIAKARKEIAEQADAFIKAKSDLLRNAIERKMNDYEILLDDLMTQQAKLELERGMKVTKDTLLDFIAELLKGDPKDKDHQRKIIDNLVTVVYLGDDDTIVNMNIRGSNIIEQDDEVSLDELKAGAERAKAVAIQSNGVQTHFPSPRQLRSKSNSWLFGLDRFLYVDYLCIAYIVKIDCFNFVSTF